MGNNANAVLVMLAVSSAGSVWSGSAPDTGVSAVVDRLTQIEPVFLFADNAAQYNAKTHKTHEKIVPIVSSLPTLKSVIIFPAIPSCPFDISAIVANGARIGMTSDDFLSSALSDETMTFSALPPDHPIYIVYSSGTTGTPKPIVYSSPGVLLQPKKGTRLTL